MRWLARHWQWRYDMPDNNPAQVREGTELARFVNILARHMGELARQYHIKSLAVFGSYVRNEQEKGSDLDLLVEFHEVPSLFEFIRLEHHLSDLLGVKVDLVMRDALKPAIGKRILEEIVPV
jgi:predicted nucleotidyltransferase